MLRTGCHHRTFGSGVFALVNRRHGVLIHLWCLDGVSLEGDGRDVGEVVSRRTAIETPPSWLSWRR